MDNMASKMHPGKKQKENETAHGLAYTNSKLVVLILELNALQGISPFMIYYGTGLKFPQVRKAWIPDPDQQKTPTWCYGKKN